MMGTKMAKVDLNDNGKHTCKQSWDRKVNETLQSHSQSHEDNAVGIT